MKPLRAEGGRQWGASDGREARYSIWCARSKPLGDKLDRVGVSAAIVQGPANKGGGFSGFKLQAAVCARTELPLAWQVATARDHEASYALALLDSARASGFAPETCAMDKSYDTEPIHSCFEARGCRPIIPLKETPAAKRG